MKTEAKFLRETSDRFREGFDRLQKAINQLDTQQIWIRPSSESNSVGILLQHLIGNLNQWICAGVGGADFKRDRPSEFRDHQHLSKDEIVQRFINVANAVQYVVLRTNPDSLHTPVRIQDMDVTVMSALYKAVTHFEFHEGQILYIAKLLLNEKYSGIWGPRTTP